MGFEMGTDVNDGETAVQSRASPVKMGTAEASRRMHDYLTSQQRRKEEYWLKKYGKVLQSASPQKSPGHKAGSESAGKLPSISSSARPARKHETVGQPPLFHTNQPIKTFPHNATASNGEGSNGKSLDKRHNAAQMRYHSAVPTTLPVIKQQQGKVSADVSTHAPVQRMNLGAAENVNGEAGQENSVMSTTAQDGVIQVGAPSYPPGDAPFQHLQGFPSQYSMGAVPSIVGNAEQQATWHSYVLETASALQAQQSAPLLHMSYQQNTMIQQQADATAPYAHSPALMNTNSSTSVASHGFGGKPSKLPPLFKEGSSQSLPVFHPQPAARHGPSHGNASSRGGVNGGTHVHHVGPRVNTKNRDMRSLELELAVLKSIKAREDVLDRLRIAAEKLSAAVMSSGSATSTLPPPSDPLVRLFYRLVTQLRSRTLDCVEILAAWHRRTLSTQPFMYYGRPYMYNIGPDLRFLDDTTCIRNRAHGALAMDDPFLMHLTSDNIPLEEASESDIRRGGHRVSSEALRIRMARKILETYCGDHRQHEAQEAALMPNGLSSPDLHPPANGGSPALASLLASSTASEAELDMKHSPADLVQELSMTAAEQNAYQAAVKSNNEALAPFLESQPVTAEPSAAVASPQPADAVAALDTHAPLDTGNSAPLDSEEIKRQGEDDECRDAPGLLGQDDEDSAGLATIEEQQQQQQQQDQQELLLQQVSLKLTQAHTHMNMLEEASEVDACETGVSAVEELHQQQQQQQEEEEQLQPHDMDTSLQVVEGAVDHDHDHVEDSQTCLVDVPSASNDVYDGTYLDYMLDVVVASLDTFQVDGHVVDLMDPFTISSWEQTRQQAAPHSGAPHSWQHAGGQGAVVLLELACDEGQDGDVSMQPTTPPADVQVNMEVGVGSTQEQQQQQQQHLPGHPGEEGHASIDSAMPRPEPVISSEHKEIMHRMDGSLQPEAELQQAADVSHDTVDNTTAHDDGSSRLGSPYVQLSLTCTGAGDVAAMLSPGRKDMYSVQQQETGEAVQREEAAAQTTWDTADVGNALDADVIHVGDGVPHQEGGWQDGLQGGALSENPTRVMMRIDSHEAVQVNIAAQNDRTEKPVASPPTTSDVPHTGAVESDDVQGGDVMQAMSVSSLVTESASALLDDMGAEARPVPSIDENMNVAMRHDCGGQGLHQDECMNSSTEANDVVLIGSSSDNNLMDTGALMRVSIVLDDATERVVVDMACADDAAGEGDGMQEHASQAVLGISADIDEVVDGLIDQL